MITKIPYGRGFIDCFTEESETRGVLVSKLHTMHSDLSEDVIVRNSLDNPISAPDLSDFAAGIKSVLIITSDHTRPVPSRITMPIILERLRRKNPEIKIGILIATGVHRYTTEDEMVYKFGRDFYESIKNFVFVHDAFHSEMVYKGVLPSGCKLTVNALVDKYDAVIAEGFIEPHFFAGFSGGRKSILPGISSSSSVMQNHCSKLIGSRYSRTGILENNPIHNDMLKACELCNLRYIVNVVIDAEKRVVNCFAGDPVKAHLKGTEFVSEYCRVAPVFSDIVITSNGGYPLDQNVYQSIKSMTAAEASVNEGGVIICVSECGDGSGGEELYNWFVNHKDAREIADIISGIAPEDTIGDQWMAQILSRIMLRATVIMVTCDRSRSIVTDMGMKWAATVDEAIKLAKTIKPDYDGITVIPDGISVIVK